MKEYKMAKNFQDSERNNGKNESIGVFQNVIKIWNPEKKILAVCKWVLRKENNHFAKA